MAEPRPLFHAAHYNIIAKQFRESLEPILAEHVSLDPHYHSAKGAVIDLAISMVKRFQEDNPFFDPLVFLDQCSPNTELYPLSELWEDYIK